MLDRLKRLFSGSPQRTPETPAGPGVLDWITADTPHRFRIWLADPGQRNAALEILDRRLGRELTVVVVHEPDGRVRLDVVSTFKQGGAAYLRPLNVLRNEGVRVRGYERLDLVVDVPADELERLVLAYETSGYNETLRRRIDAVSGEASLRKAIEARRRELRRRAKGRFGWQAVLANAAYTTPGAEAILLEEALGESDASFAAQLTGPVAGRGTLAELVSLPFDPSPQAVITLARRPQPVAEAAFNVAAAMPSPLPAELTAILCKAARRGGLDDLAAVIALRKAAPTADVRAALEAALESSIRDVSDVAMVTLGRVFRTAARPYWQAGLASISAPRRMAAEEAIGMFGDAGDVPLAAEHLGKIIRRKSTISYSPPRGSEIITLLARHRDLPESRAALDDLVQRWARLPDELQAWLRTYHPNLVGGEAQGSAAPAALIVPAAPADDAPESPTEAPLEWPLPSIERKGKEFHLGFWDTELTDVRDRFEDLAAANHAITIIDGDREWGTYRVEADDPEALLADLWVRAQAPAEEG